MEGTTSNPVFAKLNGEDLTLTYNPQSTLLVARSFAVFISGHLKVNETIQMNMSAVSEYS